MTPGGRTGAEGTVTFETPAEGIELARARWREQLVRTATWVQQRRSAPDAGPGLVVFTEGDAAAMHPGLAAREDLLVVTVPGPWPLGMLLEVARDVQLVLDLDAPTPDVLDAVGVLTALGFPAAQVGLLTRAGATATVRAAAADDVALGRRTLLRPLLRHRSSSSAARGAAVAGGTRMREVLRSRDRGGRVGVSMPAEDAERATRLLWAAALIDDIARDRATAPGAAEPTVDRQALLDMPRPGRQVVASGCAGSGTCVTVCPMGALDRPLADGVFSLRLDAASCVECGLCVEHCPEEALSLEPGASWGGALGVDLARGAVTECARCRMPHGRAGQLCAVCAFRRENPSGMWLPPGFVRPGHRH